MDSNGLIELRRQILEQAMPLLDKSSLSAEEKFQLSMQIAQSQGTLEAYNRAFQLAQEMDESTDRLNALLDLLGEVDFAIQEEADSEAWSDSESDKQASDSRSRVADSARPITVN